LLYVSDTRIDQLFNSHVRSMHLQKKKLTKQQLETLCTIPHKKKQDLLYDGGTPRGLQELIRRMGNLIVLRYANSTNWNPNFDWICTENTHIPELQIVRNRIQIQRDDYNIARQWERKFGWFCPPYLWAGTACPSRSIAQAVAVMAQNKPVRDVGLIPVDTQHKSAPTILGKSTSMGAH